MRCPGRSKAYVLVLVVGAIATASSPPVAATAGEGSLRQRVIELERQLRELRERVGAFERRLEPSQLMGTPTPTPRGNWQDRENCSALKPGMTFAQVRARLGEPQSIDVDLYFVYWRYGTRYLGPHVYFDKATVKVNGWQEPP